MDYTKVRRDQVASYLNTTPAASPTWGIIGIGVTDYGQSFNPQVETEKWITRRNANSELSSYQIQGDISQKVYSDDPLFEYINGLRRNASVGNDAESHVLDIDMFDEVSDGVYKATHYDCTIAITKYMAEDAVIEYSVYYNGNPTLGTVVITDGVPVFTADAASL